MRISIIGPGIMEIPPKGWGAVEILIHEYYVELRRLGIEVQIVNTTDLALIADEVNSFDPDFVHCQYDNYAAAFDRINCPYKAITSHFGYLEQIWSHPEYIKNVHEPIVRRPDINIFALSSGIADVYGSTGVDQSRIFVLPNGVRLENFSFADNAKYLSRSICLAKVDYRKRQSLIQSSDSSVDFAGNLCPTTAIASGFDPNLKSYLGEWTKTEVYKNLTDYANLILLSDGEAHALVCMEALASGLGLVLSQYATANLDINRPFIDVVPEERIHDRAYLSRIIRANRMKSLEHRLEIRTYAQTFDWKFRASLLLDHIKTIHMQRKQVEIKNVVIDNCKPAWKIAVVAIAVGDYLQEYFPAFERSILNKFCSGHTVHIFCFTDGHLQSDHRTTLVSVAALSWPFNTLLRFHLLSAHQSLFQEFDYIVYLDVDMEIVDDIDASFFSAEFVAVTHPGFLNKDEEATFEIDPGSTAFVEKSRRKNYVQGCLFGARGSQFQYLVNLLKVRVSDDLRNGIIAVWHDESYLNWFCAHHEVTRLPISFAYPEQWKLSISPHIIHRHKNHDVVRRISSRSVFVNDLLHEDEGYTNAIKNLCLKSHERLQYFNKLALSCNSSSNKFETPANIASETVDKADDQYCKNDPSGHSISDNDHEKSMQIEDVRVIVHQDQRLFAMLYRKIIGRGRQSSNHVWRNVPSVFLRALRTGLRYCRGLIKINHPRL